MLRTGRSTLRVTAAAAAAVFVMTAGTIGSAAAGTNHPDARAGQKDKQCSFTQTGTGAHISQDGSTSVYVYAIKNSVDGEGATVSTLDTNAGTIDSTRYTAGGVLTGKETFTLGAPDASGMVPVSGSGKCTGGKSAFKNNKCSYTFTGTLNPQTTVVTFQITGTFTR